MWGQRLKDERGFTLFEILIVTVIVGILAALALTQVDGKRASAQDSEAKMNVGSMHAHVETCFVESEDYRVCETGDPRLSDTGIAHGRGPGETRVKANKVREFVIESTSRSGNVFLLERSPGQTVRSCVVRRGRDRGGCRPDDSW